MTYLPPQCTEREPDGTWEDCTWASIVMLGNAAHAYARYPSTQAEYEALRRASGDSMTGGSNLDDATKGMDRRWGWHGTLHGNATEAIKSLPVGSGVALNGWMGSVSAHLRRWDPNFQAAHCVYAQRTSQGYWWMNPQAPASYPGEYVSLAELVRYTSGLQFARAMTVRVGQRSGQPHWKAAVSPEPRHKTKAFALYTVASNDRVTSSRVATSGGFSADCTPPRPKGDLYQWPGHTDQDLVILTTGSLADKAAALGVRYAVRRAYAVRL